LSVLLLNDSSKILVISLSLMHFFNLLIIYMFNKPLSLAFKVLQDLVFWFFPVSLFSCPATSPLHWPLCCSNIMPIISQVYHAAQHSWPFLWNFSLETGKSPSSSWVWWIPVLSSFFFFS
jgi:hypothetical protein